MLSKLSIPFLYPTLRYMGRRYPVEVLYPFLNGKHFYQHSFGEWVIHYLRYRAVAPALITAAAVMLLRRKRSDVHHVHSLRLITSRELGGAIESAGGRGWHRFAAVRLLTNRSRPAPMRIANVGIPSELEPQHFLLTGKTGSGKWSCIRQLARQIEPRGGIGIVLEPDAEYVAELYRPERGDIILNLLDERCPHGRHGRS